MTAATSRILLVEDEINLARGIKENLEAEGYGVEHVTDGLTALDRIRHEEYGLVVLDIMLPGMDGIAVCQTVRREGRDVPVLFLTARGASDDRVKGLQSGGDDYLSKPFDLRELLLRVAAIIRRRSRYDAMAAKEPVVRFGDNEFDFRSFRGRSWAGEEQILTQKEAMILKVLAEREGQVVWRDEMLDLVWGDDILPSTRTIDNFIVRLRKRFEPDPEKPRYFHTVRGVGYRFTAGGEEEK